MDAELIAAYLAGELDEEGLALLEEALAEDPELARLLADQVTFDQALRALLGDGGADRKVVRSVLGVLDAKPVESFKTDFMQTMAPVEEEPLVSCPLPSRKPRTALKTPAAPRPARALPVRRFAAGLAAAVALAAGVALLALREAPPGPDTATYVLSASKGSAVKRGEQYRSARPNTQLQPGDLILTGRGQEVKIGFSADPTRVTLKESSELKYVRGSNPKQIELAKGQLETSVAPETGDRLIIMTPGAEVRAQDAQFVLSHNGSLRVEVRKGGASVRRRSDGASVALGADQYAVVGDGLALEARALAPQKAPAGAAEAAVATLLRVQGEVYVFAGSPADRKRAQAGHRMTAAEGLVTEGKSSLAVLAYPDDTHLEVAGDSVVRKLADAKAKHVLLDQGAVTADVVRQPADRPMTLETPHAGVRVVGTRFVLTAQQDFSRVQVDEGAVRFTRTRDKQAVDVRSGYYAVASLDLPLEAIPVPGGARYLEIDLASGAWDGDGAWTVQGRSVRQAKISRNPDASPLSPASNLLFKAATDRGIEVEAVVHLNQVSPEGARGQAAWGFGLVAEFADRSLVLRSLQGGAAGSAFEFKGVKAQPFEHGRDGTYRMKLKIERRKGAPAVLQGKFWQGDREPDGWLIEDELVLEGPLTQVGFQTVRSACTFTGLKVKILKQESP